MTEEEIVTERAADAHKTWAPVVGEVTLGLSNWLVSEKKLPDEAAFNRVRGEALQILKSCHPFEEPNARRTGLVVGYVQSGKTMSMTTVSALARDNGCRLIILLAGVTTNLLSQSQQRLTEQLRGAAPRASWRINTTEGLKKRIKQLSPRLGTAIEEWKDAELAPDQQQTYVFLVLKQKSHLSNMHELLRSHDFSGAPALIFDDEADQASLNTKAMKAEESPSTTYQWIEKIRGELPHHTFLQYTATPQAPLLIKLDDTLSPEFVELVEPGKGYTGGKYFFGGSPVKQVRQLPAEELFKAGSPPSSPPDGLLKALREFFVGCAIARVREWPGPRSMLVHPSQRSADHTAYLNWVVLTCKQWTKLLKAGDDSTKDLEAELRVAYDDLAVTEEDLPEFDKLLAPLKLAIGRVNAKELNSIDGSDVDWQDGEEHILVGGEKLNRGFTVEGLTVTYMPRSPGGNNADTIQQRARFFGYKKKFAGLCRIYLHPEVTQAYRDYVTHEEDIRAQLAGFRGRPLSEWKRAFFLNTKLKPARKNVLSMSFIRLSHKKSWFIPNHVPIADNRQLVVDYCQHMVADPAEAAGYSQHLVSRASLLHTMERLLVDFRVGIEDEGHLTAARIWLSDILDSNPKQEVLIVRMRKTTQDETRDRKHVGFKLFQGRSSASGADKYKGDDKLFDPTLPTIQIHWLNITDKVPPQERVPALAIHIPTKLKREGLLIQDE